MARNCTVCRQPLPKNARAGAEYCSAKCKQATYRARKSQGRSVKPKPKAKPSPVIDKREFDRMMDGSGEDELRYARDRLKQRLDDPGTPANAMANLAALYLAVCEKLHSLSGGDPPADMPDEQEVSEDIGAEVV